MTIPDGWLTVVGVEADGRLADQTPLAGAAAILGGARQLALLGEPGGMDGPGGPERIAWPSPLRAGLADLLADLRRRYGDRPVVALASGDPLLSGIGARLIDLLGADAVRIVPARSSVALARARMGWPAEGCAVVSVVGRPLATVRRELAPGARLLVLSADETTPPALAALLVEDGYGESRMTVLGDLGAAGESRRTQMAADLIDDLAADRVADAPTPRLNIVAVECAGPLRVGWSAGLPDDVFEHDGQLTKRDLRASALARLMPAPGQLLWDIGAGAGSVGIEWMRAHPRARALAVEVDRTRAARIERNAARLGVPGLRVVRGRAPAALEDLPADDTGPDAIFVGGGATAPGLLEACLAALRPGGRLVVHGVTLETEALLAARYAELGGELIRIGVEHGEPIGAAGRFHGWRPSRAVTSWSLTTSVAT
ncbi:MAG: precorrin-6Y C5,15-methyltransferase (decarboxylating) subunit CbiT [Nocardioides sp.]|uniref:precorrin-6Y C5,15-methyltransferase (decarboxylating) subunit CbiT n=1 Tax=Nocardioides sp. TaxID=35761 RepID=UPI0039E65EA0